MNGKRSVVGCALAVVCSSLVCERAHGWGIGSETAITNVGVAHQWAANEGWKLFKYQFGASEIDAYVGAAAEHPNEANSRWIEGVYDEDIKGENPFGYTAVVNHPSLRHFWSSRSTSSTPGGGDYSRDFDDGLANSDSAANMAMKYFTGGYGLTGTLDSAWGDGQGAVIGKGVTDIYKGNGVPADRGKAYYWFGHTVHLLQDIAMPAHALADSHQEGVPILPNDPDPVHDYVDGKEFDANGNNGLPYADFSDVNPTRYTMWKFIESEGGVGRTGVDSSMIRSKAESAQGIMSAYTHNAFPAETMNSVPANANATVLPYYLLFTETARLGARFDSKDYPGQVDRGARYADYRTFDLNGFYNNWTKTEIEEVADKTYTQAMFATASAIRFFYSLVDTTAPVITLDNLSGDANAPAIYRLGAGQTKRDVPLNLLGGDDISGVDQFGFGYDIARLVGANWVDFGGGSGIAGVHQFPDLTVGDYRVLAKLENGAGLVGNTGFRYFRVAAVPEPGTAWLGLAAAMVLVGRARHGLLGFV